MNSDGLWSRRKFSKAAVSAQLLFGSGLLNVYIGCSTQNETNIASKDESIRQILKLIMDEIIPHSEIMPSASEIGGIEYIFGVFDDYPDLKQPFMQIVAEINTEGQKLNSDDFVKLDQQQSDNLG